MAERLFIGVDGGGSRTRARLRDEAGAMLGEGEAGPGNARLGDAGYEEVMKACRAAVVAAGLDGDDLGRIHAGFGLAGTQQERDRQAVLDRSHPFASLTVDTDAYAAYLGAFRGGDGAVLILGTGSCGLAVIGGKRTSVGGWGAEISDEGSGAVIGRLAIRRSLWALEGMAPRSPLAEDVLAVFDRDPQNAVAWADQATPGDFAEFAPRVFDHADEGDQLAIGIIDDTARDATMLIDRLTALGAPAIAMVGGIFPHLYKWLPERVQPVLVEAAGSAVDGAILMAVRALAGIGTGRR
jgi:glucosamine kinase